MEYQIVLYDDQNVIVNVYKPVTGVLVENNNVRWDTGSLIGINTNFIVIDANEPIGEIGEQLSQETINKDKKYLLNEVANLKEQIKSLQEVINFLLGL